MSGPVVVHIDIDDEHFIVAVEGGETLADVLRDRLDLTATHIGCDEGVCGACTVLIKGRSQRACLTLAVQADRQQISTIKSFHRDPLRARLQQAFRQHMASQCGFCTPGMLAVAAEFVAEAAASDATERDIRDRIGAVLCRCTGYQPVVDAIQDAIAWKRAQ